MGQYTTTTFIWQELHLELDEQHLICFNLILLQSSKPKAAEKEGQGQAQAMEVDTQAEAVDQNLIRDKELSGKLLNISNGDFSICIASFAWCIVIAFYVVHF